MADLVLIPIILLLLYKIEYKRDGIFEDYLSIERTNILKAVMAVDVFLFHLTLSYLNVDTTFMKVASGDDAVKIFFFLSGFGLAVSYKRKGQAYLNGFLSKRFAKILVPLIIVAIINAGAFEYTGTYYTYDSFNLSNIYHGFIDNGLTLVYNSWYVIELMILYIVFYFSFKISGNNFQRGINISVTLTMLVMGAFYMLAVYKTWLAVWFYSTYVFAFGLIWGAKEEKILTLAKKKHDYLFMIGVPASMITVIVLRMVKPIMEIGIYQVLKSLLVGPLMILGVILAGMKIRINCRVWKILGTVAYEIYLVHGLVYNLLRSNKIYIDNDVLYVCASLGIAIVLAFAVHYLSQGILKVYFKIIESLQKKEKMI